MAELCTYSRAFRGYTMQKLEKRCFRYGDPPSPGQVTHASVQARRYRFVCTDSCAQDRKYRFGCTHSCVQVCTYRFVRTGSCAHVLTYRFVCTDASVQYAQARKYRLVCTVSHVQARTYKLSGYLPSPAGYSWPPKPKFFKPLQISFRFDDFIYIRKLFFCLTYG